MAGASCPRFVRRVHRDAQGRDAPATNGKYVSETAPPEISARDKYHCPSCGAEAVWNPGKQALVCGYCSTVSPAKLADDGSIIREHDLLAALQNVPESERGLGAPRVTVKCQSCQAVSSFDPRIVAQRCEFCGSASLVPYEAIKEAISPESLLPFKLPETEVRDRIRKWYQSRWFAPNKLGSRALTDTIKGVYIPYWTFDAQVHADWTAESGTYYYETEHYTDGQGRRQTRTVQKVRWRWVSGSLDHFFDDHLICGSVGVNAKHIRRIEPFPTKELVPYDPGYVSGWIVERYSVDLSQASLTSQQEMHEQVVSMCSSQVPGDTQRNLSVKDTYSDRTFKHILSPIWLLTYDYGSKSFQVIVNGYTGAISGDFPKSFWKIFFLVVTILALIGIGLLIASR